MKFRRLVPLFYSVFDIYMLRSVRSNPKCSFLFLCKDQGGRYCWRRFVSMFFTSTCIMLFYCLRLYKLFRRFNWNNSNTSGNIAAVDFFSFSEVILTMTPLYKWTSQMTLRYKGVRTFFTWKNNRLLYNPLFCILGFSLPKYEEFIFM